MPLSEAEELEMLELEEQEAGHAPANEQAPKDPGFGPTADHKMRNFGDVDWIGAIKNELTKPLDPSAKAMIESPAGMLMQTASPVTGPMGAVASAIAKPVTGAISGLAERFATSPLPGKIADATNVVGKTKSFAQRMLGPVAEQMGPSAQKVFDFISGAEGRKLAYSNPLTGIPQGISDAAKVAGGAQKAVAWAIDNSPKYAPIFKKAMTAGPAAVATTNFLLQQKDPEYQKLVKDQREGK